MRIQIGGYLIHPLLIIIVIAIPIIIAIITILLINAKQDNKNKELYKITQYQKKKLNEIIAEEIENSPKASAEYHKTLKSLQGYITRKRYWNYDELIDIHSATIITLSTIIFDKIKEDVEKNNKNEAVLLCHALDFINYGVEYQGKEIEWLGDEIECNKNHVDMTDCEGRLFKILTSTVEKLKELIDPDLEKIPEIIGDIDPVLKTYKEYDFDAAHNDLLQSVDFRNLQPETYDICSRGLVYVLNQIIQEMEKESIPDFELYYVRALACCLDRQLYDKIITSIDY